MDVHENEVQKLDVKKNIEKLNTSELMVQCLESEGVKYIFGIPGEENLTFLHALKGSKIKFITTRHEQGAAFMADVYGRLTGTPGVCLSTLGPGATNLMTGVADANMDGAPLVAITGQAGTDRMHLVSHQHLDLISMFAPITKWNKQIVRPDTAPEIIRKAFKLAIGEKPGAVHIDLPENIASMAVLGRPLAHGDTEKSYATYSSIKRAADAISNAKNPVIIAGNGIIRSKASKALTEMVEKLRIPVANTFMAKGVVSYKNPLSLWSIGLAQRDYVNRFFEKVDLVIAVGYDIVEYDPKKWNKNENIEIIHIAEENAEVNKCYIPEVEVIGDISYSINEISALAHRVLEPVVALHIKTKMEANYESYAKDFSYPMKPQKILYDLRKVMGDDDIVISDVGAHKMWIARHYRAVKPNTCLISNGFASMGIAVPGAVAAKLVNPQRKVVAVTGDGGFMMNSQEIETALRIKTPFVTLIFNDACYGLIKWKQQDRYGEDMNVRFTNPDFVMYAEAMGAKGYRITKAEDLIPTLKEALAQNIPAIIDCPVDYSENVKLTNALNKLE
ncbi:acetolactate synthase large subunit [Clostridium estertheticum]|uniref:acetolactate synthase large subunit n=1 Tax=Clostridium estertheticum TaxID=238834 RepID=UPI001CF5C968|nr:acetolactate synthase large subunit [Clostridium estertheticum]MCB2308923.1 acetolactate synthase large subunit [Clostridium estertheticum]MCB2347360.1 acetolactate synthase large subunit [Clostridium estertheticum]MCB2351985.1 acetolactate synthase large subunit [Clostridium estertheticum]WAG46348.1 acetolactate synthase large subunit [Clostridium estertheticum]